MIKYVYPKLPCKYDFYFFRVAGSGLANCLFIFARAYVQSKESGVDLISPAWFQVNIGPYLRREKDKRHYIGIFRPTGIRGLKKLFVLTFFKKRKEKLAELNSAGNKKEILIVEGLNNFFIPISNHQPEVSLFISSNLSNRILSAIPPAGSFSKTLAVHIRLGDFVSALRTPLQWYTATIDKILKGCNGIKKLYIFSDGTDIEIAPVIKEFESKIEIQRFSTGDAMGDIISISRCAAVIGSDSTFSAWGSYLGCVPSVFPKMHFGIVSNGFFNDVVAENETIPLAFFNEVANRISNIHADAI